MLLTDFKFRQKNVFENFSIEHLSIDSSEKLLESARSKINRIKNSGSYLVSEQDRSYLSLVVIAKLLEEHILSEINKRPRRKSGKTMYTGPMDDLKVVYTRPKKDPTKVTNSDKEYLKKNKIDYDMPDLREADGDTEYTGLGSHYLSRAAHTLGSAAGAFRKGLKGEEIHNKWGMHTIVDTKTGKKMNAPDRVPKTRDEIESFIEQLISGDASLSSLDEDAQRRVTELMMKLYTTNKLLGDRAINNAMGRIPELSSLVGADRQRVSKVFIDLNHFGIESREKAAPKVQSAEPKTARAKSTKTRPEVRPKHEPSGIEADVISAMRHQEIPMDDAVSGLNKALAEYPEYKNNFDKLFRLSVRYSRPH